MWSNWSDAELEAQLTDYSRRAKEAESLYHDLRREQTNVKAEIKARRARGSVTIPFWALEMLSAHARKRFENLSPRHTTMPYEKALVIASRLLDGDVWPRDIDGEYHGADGNHNR